MKALHNTQMTKPKDSTTLQQKRRPSKGLPRIMQEVQLVLTCQSTRMSICRRARSHRINRQRNLRHIILNKQFRARTRAVVQPRCRDIPQIPHESSTQQIYQTENIF